VAHPPIWLAGRFLALVQELAQRLERLV